MITSNGYVKLKSWGTGLKYYRAVLLRNGSRSLSRRRFKRASGARNYSKALADRVNRMEESMAKSEKEQVKHLVNCGSVESLKDTLDCARRGYYSQGVLLEALRRFEAGGQKTKALLIERALKKLAKVKHE